LSSKSDASTPSISKKFWNETIVKSYGPFYNIGGGDVKKGATYIIFYSAEKKVVQRGKKN